jgi:hypothetical protein
MDRRPRRRFAIADDANCEHERVSGLASDGGANRYYRCQVPAVERH